MTENMIYTFYLRNIVDINILILIFTVTHGCIVASLKLYMPDGQEAKARYAE